MTCSWAISGSDSADWMPSATAAAANRGQRGSAARSALYAGRPSASAVRHGPSPRLYCSPFTRPASSSLQATVSCWAPRRRVMPHDRLSAISCAAWTASSCTKSSMLCVLSRTSCSSVTPAAMSMASAGAARRLAAGPAVSDLADPHVHRPSPGCGAQPSGTALAAPQTAVRTTAVISSTSRPGRWILVHLQLAAGRRPPADHAGTGSARVVWTGCWRHEETAK